MGSKINVSEKKMMNGLLNFKKCWKNNVIIVSLIESGKRENDDQKMKNFIWPRRCRNRLLHDVLQRF